MEGALRQPAGGQRLSEVLWALPTAGADGGGGTGARGAIDGEERRPPMKTPRGHDCDGPTPDPTGPTGRALVFCAGCERHRQPGFRPICNRCSDSRAASEDRRP